MAENENPESAAGSSRTPPARKGGGRTPRRNSRTARSRVEDLMEERKLREELGELWERD